MLDMINDRRNSETKVEKHDLFSSLLDGNDDEDFEESGDTKLTDRELLGMRILSCPFCELVALNKLSCRQHFHLSTGR